MAVEDAVEEAQKLPKKKKKKGARVIGIATAVGFAAAFVLRKVLTGV